MKHVEIAKSISGRDDLEKRLTGRFYTPPLVAERLAVQALSVCSEPESVCDPFCGDGRLVVAWLRAAMRKSALRHLRRVVLWDYDERAVALAKTLVSEELAALGQSMRVSVVVETGDTFERALTSQSSFDTILTNPPWELLKPDARDGVDARGGFKEQLRNYASALAHDFPGAMSAKGKAMTGYGVNLARAGAIASAMLTTGRGALAIVLPASIFADQASGPFRREFFARLGLTQLDWYPAEARLFDGVDQSFVTATATAGMFTSSFLLTRYGKDLDVVEKRISALSSDASRPLALNVAADQEALVETLSAQHASLSVLEEDMRFGLWLGRELDETRLIESVARPGDGIPFLKGRHVFPYQVVRGEVLHIDPRKRRIPATVSETRLAWRDVSRPNQRRRMHVALVPKGNVTGNSLGVAYFRYGAAERVRVLMAVMNSLVFELQVRTHLATVHVSQGVLRACVVPMRCFEDPGMERLLLKLVDARLRSSGELPELEVAIARAYGVVRDEFDSLLDAFPKIAITERAAFLRSELWT